jgi:hypothetical protein
MKRGMFFLAFVFIFIGLVGFSSASLEYKNNSIGKIYSEGSLIDGYVSMAFTGEEANNIFSSNFEGNISLLDLLNLQDYSKGEYNCSTAGCASSYSTEEIIENLNLVNEEVVGFEIKGKEIEITKLNIDLESDIGPKCLSQLRIDFLNDGEMIFSNNVYSSETCFSKNYGCFDNLLGSSGVATLTDTPFCEKISLRPAPAYSVGARIKNSTTGSAELKMKIFDLNSNFLGECILPKHKKKIEDLSCIVEYGSVELEDHYVCVVSNTNHLNGPNYKINLESGKDQCGTTDFGDSFGEDFEIFASSLGFDDLDLSINESLFKSFYPQSSLVGYINDYIDDIYNGQCENLNCVIPIKLFGESQGITFNNTRIFYNSGLIPKEVNFLNSISKEEPKITSGLLNVNIGRANFTIPFGSNENKFILYLNGEKVFEQKINISNSFSFDISPKFALIGVDTEFMVKSGMNISSSIWNFGDGSQEVSGSGNILHKFLEKKTYNVEVKVNDKSGIESIKTFEIVVGDPRESANFTLSSYESRISKITNELDTQPAWVREELSDKIGFDDLQSKLSSLRKDFDLASSDEDFLLIINSLLNLNVPFDIFVEEFGSIPASIGLNNIDTSYIETLSNRESSDKNLKDNIASWMNKHYDLDIEFERYSALLDSGSESILTKFDLKITKKVDEGDSNKYLIIDWASGGLKFMKDYGVKGLDSGTYLVLKEDEGISFIIEGAVEVEELGIYISPEIQRLGNVTFPSPDLREYPFWIVSLTILGVFILTLVVYVFLQEWYKRKYETHLFRNKDDLYNIFNFINNSRTIKMSEGEIEIKLKASGWSGEQITYAFKKLDGERTGMFEIPLFRFSEQKKIRQRLTNGKAPVGPGTRFIKRNL